MTYYPILKLSNAEFGALSNLKKETYDLMTPVIESKMIKPDKIDTWWSTFKTLGTYIQNRLGNSSFIYDFQTAFEKIGEVQELTDENGKNLVEFCIAKLEEESLEYTPCVHFDSPDWIINSAINSNSNGIAIRIRCHDFNSPMEDFIVERIKEKIISQAKDKSITLLLDFYDSAPNEARIENSIKRFSELRYDHLILALTTCPENSNGVAPHSFISVKTREEYLLYNKLKRNFSDLEFSDYTVRLKPQLDEANIDYYKTYLKLFYTIEDEYYIAKSTLLGDNGIKSFQDICTEIVNSDVYYGESFSYGDKCIKECSEGQLEISGHSKPIEIGINHHIELIVTQL